MIAKLRLNGVAALLFFAVSQLQGFATASPPQVSSQGNEGRGTKERVASGVLEYIVGVPGQCLMTAGPASRRTTDKSIAESIFWMSRRHKELHIWVSAANLDAHCVMDVGKSVERLSELVTANASKECKVDIVVAILIPAARLTASQEAYTADSISSR